MIGLLYLLISPLVCKFTFISNKDLFDTVHDTSESIHGKLAYSEQANADYQMKSGCYLEKMLSHYSLTHW